MNKKFGLWPKLALLFIIGAFALNKYQVANQDLKDFKADRAQHESDAKVIPQVHVGTLIVEQPADPKKLGPPVDTQNVFHDAKPGKLDHSEVYKTTGIFLHPDKIPIAYSQAEAPIDEDSETPAPVDESSGGVWGFIKLNWATLVTAFLAFVEAIIRITPSQKDNSIFAFIKFILDKIIPNARAGGGTHA